MRPGPSIAGSVELCDLDEPWEHLLSTSDKNGAQHASSDVPIELQGALDLPLS